MSMVRKQLYIAPEQQRKLRSLARRWGCTEAEVVRTAIDRLPDFESAVDARLREAGLLAPPRYDDDLPSEEEFDAMERELDEILAETVPLHLAEVVIEDRR
jgi:antitoxin ParD1/3/4